jgi:hypothetical protein
LCARQRQPVVNPITNRLHQYTVRKLTFIAGQYRVDQVDSLTDSHFTNIRITDKIGMGNAA